MKFLRQSTAQNVPIGPFVLNSDGNTTLANLTIAQADLQISKAGGNFSQSNNSAGAPHLKDGWYSAPFDTTDTNTLGMLTLEVKTSLGLPVWHEMTVLPAAIYDALIAGNQSLLVALGNVAHGGSGASVNFNLGINGNWTGNHTGNTTGNLIGNVTGTVANVTGNVAGTTGNITGVPTVTIGNFSGQGGTLAGLTLGGNLTVPQVIGNLQGNVNGNITGTVKDVLGNVTGNLGGNVNGNVLGNVSGTIGNVTGVATVQLGNIAHGGTAATLTLQSHQVNSQPVLTSGNLTDIANAANTTLSSAHGSGSWATATGFSTHTAADVWAVATRVLTAGTNIALAKGTGVTGFNDISTSDIQSVLTSYALPESYASDGGNFTLAQGLYEICQFVTEFSIASTTYTVKKRDGSTTAFTLTLNDATNPTGITRAS